MIRPPNPGCCKLCAEPVPDPSLPDRVENQRRLDAAVEARRVYRLEHNVKSISGGTVARE